MPNVIPAYGRDYKNIRSIKLDLLNGRDFVVADNTSRWDGKPINLEQFESGDIIFVRYNKQTKVARIVKDEKLSYEEVLDNAEKHALIDIMRGRSISMSPNIEITLRDAGLISIHHRNVSITMKGCVIAEKIVSKEEGLAT